MIYWQCAYVIPKGTADEVKACRARQIPRSNRRDVARLRETGSVEIDSWDKVKLLTVAVDRLRRWYRPGLLCIGDAAHAMSPIGGVGINLAVQDAVAGRQYSRRPLAPRGGHDRNSQGRATAARISHALYQRMQNCLAK